MTISQLAVLDPDWDHLKRRKGVETYEEFIEVLYDDITRIVAELERHRSSHGSDGEDRITIDICRTLKQWCYYVEHEANRSGNGDILVRSCGLYEWLGEAKIFTDLSVMQKAFLQLATRYSGAATDHHGGIIAYIKRPDASRLMSDWRDKLGELYVSMTFGKCMRRQGMAFSTCHLQQDTGMPLEIWHVGVALHSAPKDATGVIRRPRRAKS